MTKVRSLAGATIVTAFALLLLSPAMALAATLGLSPATGVYTIGNTFSVQLTINTQGAAINAADGALSFNPKELQVVAVSRASSIFNLWTTEPTFSNTAGTISFSGGTPTGYTGAAGNVLTVTFRTLQAGSPRVTMSSGSVLAADGRGTNVLRTMGSAAYTVSAATNTPAPEVIVEYVAPANTPSAPRVTSTSHPDSTKWYNVKTADLAWDLPSGITAVRTLLDDSPNSIPTKVYETPITSLSLADLPEGVSYFHIQLKNDEGWGRVTHYRLGVDSVSPVGFSVSQMPNEAGNPVQTLLATTTDTTGSPIVSYSVRVNGGEPKQFDNSDNTYLIPLTDLVPGHHTVWVEAIDAAGNRAGASVDVVVTAFTAPTFATVPAEINSGVVPVFEGETRPDALVRVTLQQATTEPIVYEVTSDADGRFRFIPDAALAVGVYKLTLQSTDAFGAMSEISPAYQFVVREPGYVRIGTMLVNVFSVVLSLLGIVALLILGSLYVVTKSRRLLVAIRRETGEVSTIVHEQFIRLHAVVNRHEEQLQSSRKTKRLTAAESALIAELRTTLEQAEEAVKKEASDVTRLTD